MFRTTMCFSPRAESDSRSSPPDAEAAGTSHGQKRKSSSTKAQDSWDTPPKRSKSLPESKQVARTDSKAPSGQVTAANKVRGKTMSLPHKQLGHLPARTTTIKPNQIPIVELNSSPVRPKEEAGKAWMSDAECISEPDDRPAWRKVRLGGKARSVGGNDWPQPGQSSKPVKVSQTEVAKTTKTVKPGMAPMSAALSQKSANAVPSTSAPLVTPAARLRPKPAVAHAGKGQAYQSRDKRASSTESEGIVVAPSSSTIQKTAAANSSGRQKQALAAADEVSHTSSKENKARSRPRPVPSASLSKGKQKTGPSKPTFAGASSSSATRGLTKKVSNLDVSASPRVRKTLRAASPGMQPSVHTSAARRTVKGRHVDSSTEDDTAEHFGNATQAVWITNAFQGRDMEGSDSRFGNMSDSDPEVELLGDDSEDSCICPFCDGPLPPVLSKGLHSMLTRLCERLDVARRPGSTNPNALLLDASVTAEACKRHRDEHTLIPEGLKRGYPAPLDIDFARLKQRFVNTCYKRLAVLGSGTTESPFFDAAKEDWEQYGAHRMGSVVSQFSTFQQELPG